MRILIIHNKYRHAGGEDAVVELERQLLSTAHDVDTFIFDNDGGAVDMIRSLFSSHSAQGIAQKLDAFSPDVVHVHNVWYSAGPDLLSYIKSLGYPLVQTLHNYRSLCLNGMLTLNGSTCTACLDKDYPVAGILNKCNRDSLASSALVGAAVAWHRRKQTFLLPDRVICLTSFQQELMIASHLGFEAGQLVVKPNYYPDRHAGQWRSPTDVGDYFLYAGRLTKEKGVDQLVNLAKLGIKIKVAGTGPESARLELLKANSPDLAGLELLGWQTPDQVTELMFNAKALLLPSTWHEGLPVVLVQALAEGCPVIASANENLTALVPDGVAGMTCPAEDGAVWYKVCMSVAAPDLNRDLRLSARQHYETHYSPEIGLKMLEQIYHEAIAAHNTTSIAAN